MRNRSILEGQGSMRKGGSPYRGRGRGEGDGGERSRETLGLCLGRKLETAT